MFNALRKAIFPIIIITLVVFMGLIVLEWGADYTGQRLGGDPNLAAVINGEKIQITEYNQMVSSMYQQELEKYDGDIPEDKTFEIEDNAWKQLLYDHLIMQEVAKNNIIVTDDELYAYLRLSPPQFLQQIPQFQTEGKFDYQKYLNAMIDPQAAPFWNSVEQVVKNDILKLKMQELVIQAATVTEQELKESFMEKEEKVKLGVINVGFSKYQGGMKEITDEELQEYYNQHKEKYQVDKRVVLDIVQLEKKPSDYDWEIAHKEIKTIYDSLMTGADFAEMAKTYSQDNSAQNGGDLGWFGQNQMVKEFDTLAFSMKEGEISEPFRTQFGWHIIQHHGYKQELDTPRGKDKKEMMKKAHVSHILIKVTISSETEDNLFTQLEQLLTAANERGFKVAAEEQGLPVKTTMPFTDKSNIPYIGYNEEVMNFAFEDKVGSISDILENASSYYVVSIAEKLPAGVATFEEVKSTVRGDMRNEILSVICKDTANAIYAAIKNGTTPAKAAKDYNCNYVETDLINRNNYLQDVGYEPAPIGVAFSLTEPGQISEPFSHKTGCVILKLIERVNPDLTLYTEKHDSLYTALINQKQQDLYGKWFNALLENAEVENYTARANR
ncbi:MAG: peptidylprolyl isomerase [Candidatus Zixiibacteriota bacterium]